MLLLRQIGRRNALRESRRSHALRVEVGADEVCLLLILSLANSGLDAVMHTTALRCGQSASRIRWTLPGRLLNRRPLTARPASSSSLEKNHRQVQPASSAASVTVAPRPACAIRRVCSSSSCAPPGVILHAVDVGDARCVAREKFPNIPHGGQRQASAPALSRCQGQEQGPVQRQDITIDWADRLKVPGATTG